MENHTKYSMKPQPKVFQHYLFKVLKVESFLPIPFATSYSEKIHRDKVYETNKKTYNAVQTIVSMHMYPAYWMNQKMIYVDRALQKRLKLEKICFLSIYTRFNR